MPAIGNAIAKGRQEEPYWKEWFDGFKPVQLLWPGGAPWPVRIVPVDINTVQFPLPSAARCYEFGQAIGRAIASYPSGQRVVA